MQFSHLNHASFWWQKVQKTQVACRKILYDAFVAEQMRDGGVGEVLWHFK